MPSGDYSEYKDEVEEAEAISRRIECTVKDQGSVLYLIAALLIKQNELLEQVVANTTP